MTEEARLNPAFTDLSALIEYCLAYYPEHRFAANLLDAYDGQGGKIIVSSQIWPSLNSGMTDRQRLWDFLIKRSKEYLDEDDLSATDYRSEILNYTTIEQELDLNLNQELLDDIEQLRGEFDERGLVGFTDMLDDARLLGKIQHRELVGTKNTQNYSRGSSKSPWLEKANISQYSTSDSQTESLMDFGYWRRDNEGNLLIGSVCKAARNKEQLTDALADLANTNPTVLTPKEVVENSPIFD